MIGSSRASLAAVSEQVADRYTDPNIGPAGADLLAVADLVGREKPLRSMLADGGRPSAERAAVVTELLNGKINGLAVELAAFIARQRWSNEHDLVDAFEFTGAEAMFAAAERAGDLDQIENELFRFGRTVVSDGDLQLTLSSPALPAEPKAAILNELLAGKAHQSTIDLLAFVSSHLRGRRLDQAIDQLSELAAQRRGMLLATVQSAIELDDERRNRIRAALQSLYGQKVEINVEVIPALVGGISIQIGDDLIDGSVASRLEKARRRISG
ncbi:MAG: F0F1 ATP synthase subunit delta [Actinobacteria bacterium]|nr:F0F1 ATP synthase subunit delta [Actinomycetota bacterium]